VPEPDAAPAEEEDWQVDYEEGGEEEEAGGGAADGDGGGDDDDFEAQMRALEEEL
jgi:hypothetical protein